MKLTIEHKFFKTFLFMLNGVVVVILIGLTILVGLDTELLIGTIILIVSNFFLIKEMKRIRMLIYNNHNLISVKYDNTTEVIDLKLIKSIQLTGGRISHFYTYKIEYVTSENVMNDFLVAPLRNNRFNDFLADLKIINKEVTVKRTHP